MTTTMPPQGPGSRRAVPERPTEQQRANLRRWLDQGENWMMRPNWDSYLRDGVERGRRPLEQLTQEQRIAAQAWLSQQRHALYRVLEGGRTAPDGWLEGQVLYAALDRLIEQRRPESVGTPGFAS